MPFNQSAFLKQKFEPRTALVEVPGLADFFAEGDDQVWEVRGLTSSEVAKANEGLNVQKSLSALVDAISKDSLSLAEIREKIGLCDDDVASDTIKRIEHLLVATVSDKPLDRSVVVKLSSTHVAEFTMITNKIMELTVMGMEAAIKKPLGSGKAKK